MSDYLSRWRDDLIRQGKTAEQIDQARAEQARLQESLSNMTEEEAQLLSLLRMGERFSLVPRGRPALAYRRLMLLLIIQFALSQLPRLLGYPFGDATHGLYGLNMNFLVFPILAIYRGWDHKRRLASFLLATALLAVVVNLLFWGKAHDGSPTLHLTILHLPLFFIISLALFGPHQRLVENLQGHVGLVAETLLLTFLLACATAVSMMLAIVLFEAVGWRVEEGVSTVVITGIIPLLPLVSLHLLTTKRAALQQLARLLALLFLPVFTLLMAVLLFTLLSKKVVVVQDRSLLLAIDILLALLLLMIFYATEMWEPSTRPTLWRGLIILCSSTALALDLVALQAIGVRLAQGGLSPNRLAVLAQNILLCANLLALVITLAKGRAAARLEARFLLVYGGWFLVVALIFPLLF